ncbi:hypothetical protein [Fimbriiglobus ruber]|uniref:hypothetical protein n=1 Tax=Fimbriiglobus ruber TaxID=1908690 RepID=UPI00117AB109|nr:hypothetical protein [Fimbriiglobus ruber]
MQGTLVRMPVLVQQGADEHAGRLVPEDDRLTREGSRPTGQIGQPVLRRGQMIPIQGSEPEGSGGRGVEQGADAVGDSPDECGDGGRRGPVEPFVDALECRHGVQVGRLSVGVPNRGRRPEDDGQQDLDQIRERELAGVRGCREVGGGRLIQELRGHATLDQTVDQDSGRSLLDEALVDGGRIHAELPKVPRFTSHTL